MTNIYKDLIIIQKAAFNEVRPIYGYKDVASKSLNDLVLFYFLENYVIHQNALLFSVACRIGKGSVLVSAIDKNIAVNLKRFRKIRKLSLDMVAEKTGVSKSMLGQIERGESNPTVGTVSKITEGLKIPLTELIDEPFEAVKIIENRNIPSYMELENNYKIKIMFPYDNERRFEIYTVEIQKNGNYENKNGGLHAFEYVTVMSGELTLQMDEREYVIKENDAVRIFSGESCIYHNKGDSILILNIVFSMLPMDYKS